MGLGTGTAEGSEQRRVRVVLIQSVQSAEIFFPQLFLSDLDGLS